MNGIDSFDKIKTHDITLIVKVASLLYIVFIIKKEIATSYLSSGMYKNAAQLFYDYDNHVTLYGIPIMLLMIGIVFITSTQLYEKYTFKALLIECIAFTIFFSSIVYFTNNSIPEYKFLFIFLIISTVIQLGFYYGLAICLIATNLIFYLDLKNPSTDGLNERFANDFLVAGMYFVILISLSFYVNWVNRFIAQKNKQIAALQEELSQKDNQRVFFEKAISNNSSFYYQLIDNANEAIVLIDGETILYVNLTATKLLGNENQSSFIGSSIHTFFAEEDLQKYLQGVQNLDDATIKDISFKGRLIRQSGESLPVFTTCSVFYFEGQNIILCTFKDLSAETMVSQLKIDVKEKQRELKESQEFNQLITDFICNISHELKTPVNVIYSICQLEEKKHTHSISPGYIQMTKINCHRLIRLMNNLLDISKINTGYMPLHLRYSNMIEVVEEITMSISPYTDNKDIELEFDTDTEELFMTFDIYKVEKIVLNLLSNAIKFTDPGGKISVTITTLTDRVSISVKDTGIGIPESMHNIIFQRFRQVDSSLHRNHDGSGIGLSLVKSFVELHKGTISLKSSLNQGTEFIICFPIEITKSMPDEEFSYIADIERIRIELSELDRTDSYTSEIDLS